MNLARFSELLQLPPGGTADFIHRDYCRSDFWVKITCQDQPYVSRSSKATSICNPILKYLLRLTANIVSPRFDSQGVPRRGELFMLWAALNRVRIYTAFHILTQLEKQTKSRTSVIAAGGIVTALAHGLGLGNLFPLMPILRDGARLNLEACINMEMFTMVGNQIWLNHHGHTIFPLPHPNHTTTTNEANWSYDNDLDGEGGADDDTPLLVRKPCPTLLGHPAHGHGFLLPLLLMMRPTPPKLLAPRRFPSANAFPMSLLAFT